MSSPSPLFVLGWLLPVVSCSATSPPPQDAQPSAGEQHEVFCMGSPVKCHSTAATYCRSRGSTTYHIVGQVPERGVILVTCE